MHLFSNPKNPSGIRGLLFWVVFQILSLFLTPLLASSTVVKHKKKVIVLFSYQKGWWAVEDENRGIKDGLMAMGYIEDQNIEITRLYMNTKTINKTDQQMEDVAVDLLAIIDREAPDILLTMDDDALRHVGAKLLDTPLPIVFGGINLFVTNPEYGWKSSTERTPLADTLQQPGHNITGVLERIAITSGFNLLHQIIPNAKTALFISDNSLLSAQLLKAEGTEDVLKTLPLTIVKQVFTNSYETMQKVVLEYQNKVDSIVMFLPWSFANKDGEPVPQEHIVQWLMQNNKRPGIAYLDILAKEGFLCGVVVDMVQQGFHTGILAGRILNGENPESTSILDPVANRIMINLARAKQLKIDIPFEVLRNADVLFKTMETSPELNK